MSGQMSTISPAPGWRGALGKLYDEQKAEGKQQSKPRGQYVLLANTSAAGD